MNLKERKYTLTFEAVMIELGILKVFQLVAEISLHDNLKFFRLLFMILIY